MTRRRPAGLPSAQEASRLRAKQERQHLLALYITACDYARQLEEAVTQGHSPTGYGPPLTPLPEDVAEALLAPVRAYLAQMRDLVARHAPRELATFETRQPAANTVVWASNLLERLRQVSEDLAPTRMRRYGSDPAWAEQYAEASDRLARLVAEARGVLEGRSG